MMQVYLKKSGQNEQSDIIASFKHRLDIHSTKEDVNISRIFKKFTLWKKEKNINLIFTFNRLAVLFSGG